MPALYRVVIYISAVFFAGLTIIALLRSGLFAGEVEEKLPYGDFLLDPVVDNFPSAAVAHGPEDLPPIPSWNKPRYTAQKVPLFIGFTRNWLLLQQTVVGYITSGWPAEDIYVVENTGTFNANKQNNLTLQNPFYLDHARLTNVFGVNVVSTPTLLSFAQLQNFYLHLSLEHGWKQYFWSHMDVIAMSNEQHEPWGSLYDRAIDAMLEANRSTAKWGIFWFAYDRLALVNTDAFVDVGGWDTFIPYYGTDCDMHERLMMKGYILTDAHAGLVYDVAGTVPDLRIFYREENDEHSLQCAEDAAPERREPGRGDCHYEAITRMADALQTEKNANGRDRNYWQTRQRGGKGEPFYKDVLGFERAVRMTIEFGRELMSEKWGMAGCALRDNGKSFDDQWQGEHKQPKS